MQINFKISFSIFRGGGVDSSAGFLRGSQSFLLIFRVVHDEIEEMVEISLGICYIFKIVYLIFLAIMWSSMRPWRH